MEEALSAWCGAISTSDNSEIAFVLVVLAPKLLTFYLTEKQVRVPDNKKSDQVDANKPYRYSPASFRQEQAGSLPLAACLTAQMGVLKPRLRV